MWGLVMGLEKVQMDCRMPLPSSRLNSVIVGCYKLLRPRLAMELTRSL
jgi:hypothetical protein